MGTLEDIDLACLSRVYHLRQEIDNPDPALKGSLDMVLRFVTIRYVFSELDFTLELLKEYLLERILLLFEANCN
jgi:hypothetical protein